MSEQKYKRLNELRQELANKHQLEIYKIWNNETQSLLAYSNITSTEELESIKGIGPKKIAMYGQLILNCLTNNFEPETEKVYFEPSEKTLSVALYLDYLNVILEQTEEVKVFGEIFSFNNHPTGVYMSLKDPTDPAILECYISPYTYKGLGIPLEAGMQVKLSGNPQIFKRRGSFRLQVEAVELAGEGTLKKAYDLLKAKLLQEGLFDRKRKLPEFINHVGIITAKTGAVIDDFRQNIIERGLKLTLASVRVEGKYSSAQIIDAIKTFNAQKNPPQVLVVMRGGGSLEDLQSYNQEDVVRAIFASKIPTIAAIGHDRDVPLVCLAADTYTSTPTAAAVAINNSWAALDYDLPLLEQNLINSFGLILNQVKRKIEINNQNLQLAVKELVNLALKASQTLKYIAGQLKTRMDEINSQSAYFVKTIFSGFTQMAYSFNNKVATFQTILELNNPERQLALGYSIITLKNGKVVKSIDEANVDQEIITTLKDGQLISKITGKAQNDS